MDANRHHSFGELQQKSFDQLLFKMRARPMINEIKRVPNIESILDMGCGYNANFLRNIIKIFPGIKTRVGIDLKVNPDLEGSGIRALSADLNQKLPFADQSFDIVTASALFEHLQKPLEAAREVYRILKPGGKLIITTPSPAAKPVLEILAFKLHIIDPAEILDHKNYFTKPDLIQMFLDAGFKNSSSRNFQVIFNTLTVSQK